MRFLKIFLSIIFVLTVSFFVVRGCVHRRPPYRLELGGVAAPHKKIVVGPVAAPQIPRMAIILDDWGHDFSLVQKAIEVGRPLTLSVLPNVTHSAEIARKAYESHLGVMLHMPMQPQSRKERLEPHTIMTTTPDKEIVQLIDAALESVPHAEGVNNHMGSAATSDARVMKIFLKHLKEKNLFFVDSNVIPKTVGPMTAREMSVPFTKRDVFIDNKLDLEAIKAQLRQAVKITLARSRVVVIGHDKKVTLQAIKEMVPEIERSGVRLVLVKELLE